MYESVGVKLVVGEVGNKIGWGAGVVRKISGD